MRLSRLMALLVLAAVPTQNLVVPMPVTAGELSRAGGRQTSGERAFARNLDPPLQADSLADWWDRAKQAMHHLSGCALASAGITYALIAGVAFPGAGILGLTGAAIVVLMCL